MKRALFLVAICITSLAQAQVSLTSADFPKVGDRFEVNIVEFTPSNTPVTPFLPSTTAFDIDLSNLVPTEKDIDLIEKPSDLGGGNQISGADYGVTYGIGNAFMKEDGDNIYMVGLSPQIDFPLTLAFQFDSDLSFMEAPVSYGDSVLDSTTSSISIPFVVKIDAAMKMDYEVNGYGRLKIPGDTAFDVIRIRRETTFFGTVDQRGEPEIDTLRDTMITWEFYTPGYSSTVLRVDFSTEPSEFGIDTTVRFSFYGDNIIVGRESPYNSGAFSAQVNSLVTQDLNIQSEEALSVTIFDLKGRNMLQVDERKERHQLNLSSFEKGYYLVVLEGAKGKMTKKVYKN